MKKILKYWFITSLSLLAVGQLGHSFTFANGYLTVIEAALLLTFFEYFLKPIVKLLFLPINLLTLGALRWLIDVLALFMATTFINGFQVHGFTFTGITIGGFVAPPFAFSGFLAYIISAFWLNLAIAILRWLF